MPAGKDPAIETIAPKRPIEALDEGILLGAARRDVERVALTVMQPLLERIGDELWAIIAAEVGRCASKQNQPFQDLNDLTRRNGAGDMDRQTLAGVLVEDRQHPQLPAAFGAGFEKVVRPDFIR